MIQSDDERPQTPSAQSLDGAIGVPSARERSFVAENVLPIEHQQERARDVVGGLGRPVQAIAPVTEPRDGNAARLESASSDMIAHACSRRTPIRREHVAVTRGRALPRTGHATRLEDSKLTRP